METTKTNEFMSIGELADYINMSRKFVEKHVYSRRMPGLVRVGGKWRFRREEIEKRLTTGCLLLDELKQKRASV